MGSEMSGLNGEDGQWWDRCVGMAHVVGLARRNEGRRENKEACLRALYWVEFGLNWGLEKLVGFPMWDG